LHSWNTSKRTSWNFHWSTAWDHGHVIVAGPRRDQNRWRVETWEQEYKEEAMARSIAPIHHLTSPSLPLTAPQSTKSSLFPLSTLAHAVSKHNASTLRLRCPLSSTTVTSRDNPSRSQQLRSRVSTRKPPSTSVTPAYSLRLKPTRTRTPSSLRRVESGPRPTDLFTSPPPSTDSSSSSPSRSRPLFSQSASE
jgi:hypothetical protein